MLCLVAQSCLTFCDPMDCSPPGSSVHGDSPGKNTGEGCHALLQEIFPIQGSDSGLQHCRWILYCLSHQGSPLMYYTEHIMRIKVFWKSNLLPSWTQLVLRSLSCPMAIIILLNVVPCLLPSCFNMIREFDYLFIYLFLAALGIHFCMGFFSSCHE